MLPITSYNEDKEGERMKKENLIFAFLFSVSLCGCENNQQEANRVIEGIADNPYALEITELPGFENMDIHMRPIQMTDDCLYFAANTPSGNRNSDLSAERENTAQNLGSTAVFAYDCTQNMLNTVTKTDDKIIYYDYQVYQGDSYAVIDSADQPDTQLQLTVNGTPLFAWHRTDYDLDCFLHIYQGKLYLVLYPMDGSMLQVYEVHPEGPLKMVRNAFVDRLMKAAGFHEAAPQIRMYGEKAAYLIQKEKTMELGIYENQKFHSYEIPFVGEILAVFKADVLIQTEDGACYWNLKQNQRKAVDNADFNAELTHEFQQINDHQLLYTSTHSMKLFIYRDDGTYLLQDITDRPYHIELVHGNQILFSNSSADSIHFYLGTLKD